MSDKELIKQLEEIIVDKHEEIERLKISLSAQEELTINEYHKKEQLENIIKEVREILKRHTTKFKDIYIPASESWCLLEKVGVDKE